jgi:hypothetical protein
MKPFRIFIILLLILSSCATERPNVYITTGTDYGFKPPQWTIGCNYDSLDFKVIDKIIKKLGQQYSLDSMEFAEEYKWGKIIIPELDNNTLSIKIVRRISKTRFSDNKIHNIENIAVYINKAGKDFLHPLKFQNRLRTKRFLLNIIE